MSPQIERIENAGPDRRARRLFFSGEPEPRTTSAAVLSSMGLEEGDEIDLETLEAQLRKEEASNARERALRILGYRERSVRELSRRLIDDGYPPDLTHELVERLAELGLVDDERFARAWARSRVSAGYGPARIERELAEKGIGKELSAEAIDSALGDTDPVDRARLLLRGARLDTRAERDKAVRKLVRKGFDLSTAIKAAAGDAD